MERSVPVVLLRRRPVERRLNIALKGWLWSLWLCWNPGSVRSACELSPEHLSVAVAEGQRAGEIEDFEELESR